MLLLARQLEGQQSRMQQESRVTGHGTRVTGYRDSAWQGPRGPEQLGGAGRQGSREGV